MKRTYLQRNTIEDQRKLNMDEQSRHSSGIEEFNPTEILLKGQYLDQKGTPLFNHFVGMKNKMITVSLFLLFVVQIFAQRSEPFDFDKFKAKKIAYLTDAIKLTSAEAEKFWPVYNEFDQKRFQLMQERHEMEKKLGDKIEDLSDDKYVELSRRLSSFHKTEGELFTEYNEKFLKILPPKKVVQLYVAEMNFKGFLLQEYKKGDPEHKDDH